MRFAKLLLPVLLSFVMANVLAANKDGDKRHMDSVYSWGHWNKLTPPAGGPVGAVDNQIISFGPGDVSVTTPPVEPPVTPPPTPPVEPPVIPPPTPPVEPPVIPPPLHNPQ